MVSRLVGIRRKQIFNGAKVACGEQLSLREVI